MEDHFHEYNSYPADFLNNLNSVRNSQMISDLSKLQERGTISPYILIRDFFFYRMHNDVKDREDNRDWQVDIIILTEKDRVIALQSYFKYHQIDQHPEISEIYKTTLNYLFLEKELIKNTRGVISSAQLLIKHNPRSVISSNIEGQFISIRENESSSEQKDDIFMIPTVFYCRPKDERSSVLSHLSNSSQLCRKYTFSTAYQIAKLVAYQIIYHKNDQGNKTEIANLIEQVMKCGLKEDEIFKAVSHFQQDYRLKQQIHMEKQCMDQLDNYQDKQFFFGQQEDIGEFSYNMEKIHPLPDLNHSELLSYITECISFISYKEGAVSGLSPNITNDQKSIKEEKSSKFYKDKNIRKVVQVTEYSNTQVDEAKIQNFDIACRNRY